MFKNDAYPDYATLAAEEQEGRDYFVTVLETDSTTAIMAIHAGKIEPGTSGIARALSQDGRWYNLYLFEGNKPRHNSRLHVASAHFDEPRALQLASKMDRIVTIHGMVGDEPLVLAGGLDQGLKRDIVDSLNAHGIPADMAPPKFGASTTRNIANKTKSQKGVQLEISSALGRNYDENLILAIRKVLPR